MCVCVCVWVGVCGWGVSFSSLQGDCCEGEERESGRGNGVRGRTTNSNYSCVASGRAALFRQD